MSSAREVVALAGPGWGEAIRALSTRNGAAAGPHIIALDEASGRVDWLVCFGDAPEGLATDVPVERRLIVISEPPGVMRYHPAFLAQFGTALSPFALPGFKGRFIASHPAIPWFYGCAFGGGKPARWRHDADALLAMPAPAKENLITVVLSRKTMTPLHVARLKCVEALAKRFPQAVRIYGSGFERIDDKAEVINPARFHLALENTRHADYWTEKLADSLIGWAMPIYDGAPNIGQYIPEAAFRRLDVTDVEGATRIVGDLLEAGERAVDHAALERARERVIADYSLVETLRRAVITLSDPKVTPARAAPQSLKANKSFGFKQRLMRLVRGGRT